MYFVGKRIFCLPPNLALPCARLELSFLLLMFLHPSLLLAGLATIAVPIAIHLLMRRRRKPMAWAAMRFVEEAFKKLRRRLLIQQWLLLAARCLLLAAVAFAVGRPIVNAAAALGARRGTVVVLIDDSLTEGAVSGGSTSGGNTGGTALVRSLAQAAELIRSLREGDRVAVVLMAAPASTLISPPSSDLSAVASALASVQGKDSRADVAGGLALAGAIIADRRAADAATTSGGGSGNERVVVFSAWRAGSVLADARIGKLPAEVSVSLATPLDAVSNVALSQFSLGRGVVLGQDHAAGRTARVEVVRSGPSMGEATASVQVRGIATAGRANDGAAAGQAAQEPVSFELPVTVRFSNGARKASASVALPALAATAETRDGAQARAAGGSLSLSASFAPGTGSGGTLPDAIARDNTALASAVTAERLNVAVIADGQGASAFGLDGGVGSIPPARWFELAASPSAATPVSSVVIDAALVDATVLADVDAVIVTCPQKLGEAATVALRKVIDRGGMVLLTPPADVTLHTWSDTLLAALGVAAKLPREASEIGTAVGSGGIEGTGERMDSTFVPSPAAAEMLGSLSSELADLLPAIGLRKMLAPERTDGGSGTGTGVEPLLVSSAGRIVLALLADATGGKPSSATPPASAERGSTTTENAKGDGAASEQATSEKNSRASVRGPVLYLSVAADAAWTDLPAKPLFVPLVQELLRQGAGRAKRSIVLAAGRELVLPPGAARLVLVRSMGDAGSGFGSGFGAGFGAGSGAGSGAGFGTGTRSIAAGAENGSGRSSALAIAVGADGRPIEPLRTAGLYRIVLQSGLTAGTVVVEPDTAASDTDATSRAIVERWLAPATTTPLLWLDAAPGEAATAAAAKPVTPSDGLAWLFGAALLFALLEIVLAQRADHSASGKVAMVGTLAGRRQGGTDAGTDSDLGAKGARDA